MRVSIAAGFGQMLRPGVQWQTLAAFSRQAEARPVQRIDLAGSRLPGADVCAQPAGAGNWRSRAKAAASSSAQGQRRSSRRVARRAWKASLPAVCRAR